MSELASRAVECALEASLLAKWEIWEGDIQLMEPTNMSDPLPLNIDFVGGEQQPRWNRSKMLTVAELHRLFRKRKSELFSRYFQDDITSVLRQNEFRLSSQKYSRAHLP